MALVLLWTGAEGARASCPGPLCCQSTFGDSSTAIVQAEVVEVGPGHVAIQLLPGKIYCTGGVECSPADFPVDFVWGDEACPDIILGSESIAVGDRGLFGVDLGTGCLVRFLEVTAEGVACNEYEPVTFVLEQYLSPNCIDATHAAGYYECDDTLGSCAGCAQAGQGGGLLLAMVVGMGMVRRKRPRA